jgi:hypothetical protein
MTNEIDKAIEWHNSLSVNDWKILEKKYSFGLINFHPSKILEMWKGEGMPEPQKVDSVRDIEIKVMLSNLLYNIQDKSIQSLLRYIIFTHCGDQIEWETIYNKMTELMPEILLNS